MGQLITSWIIIATFWACFSVHFQALMMKKLSYKDYNKRISIRDNGNVQSRDKEESKSSSTVSVNSGARTLTHDQMIKKKSIQ